MTFVVKALKAKKEYLEVKTVAQMFVVLKTLHVREMQSHSLAHQQLPWSSSFKPPQQ